VAAQEVDGFPDALEVDAGVEQVLDRLEQDDVLEGVLALGPGATGVLHAGAAEAGASPVIELSIGDPDQLRDVRRSETLISHVTPR
jgi:hypothetical protein